MLKGRMNRPFDGAELAGWHVRKDKVSKMDKVYISEFL